MRSPAILALALLGSVAACTDRSASAATDADLARDLQLAATSIALAPAPATNVMIETAPEAVVAPAPRPRRAPSGARRVASARPTAPSAVVEEPAPVAEQEYAESQDAAASDASSDDEASAGVALPRPVPVSVGLPGGGDYGSGPSAGEVAGGILGTIMRGGMGGGHGGSVIRGGDIDDCRIDPRYPNTRRAPPRRTGTSSGSGGVWSAVSERPRGPAPAARTGGSEGRRGGVWGRVGARQ